MVMTKHWSINRMVSYFISHLEKDCSFNATTITETLQEMFPKKKIEYNNVYQELKSLTCDGFLKKVKSGRNVSFCVNRLPYDIHKIGCYDDLKHKNWKSGTYSVKNIGIEKDLVGVYLILDSKTASLL